MSGKKPYLSEKEYLAIYTAQDREFRKLGERVMKAMKAGADLAEYGQIFLEFINRFHGDKEKIVALNSIFTLGMAIRKVSEEMEIKAGGEDPEKKMTELLEQLRIKESKKLGQS